MIQYSLTKLTVLICVGILTTTTTTMSTMTPTTREHTQSSSSLFEYAVNSNDNRIKRRQALAQEKITLLGMSRKGNSHHHHHNHNHQQQQQQKSSPELSLLPLSSSSSFESNQSISNRSSQSYNTYNTNIYMFIFLSALYGLISFISVVGNCLIIYVVAKNKRMQNVTNYFISNLALADVVIGMFATPFQFQAAYLQRWIFPDIMCKIVPFAATLSVNVSIITLVAISLDRYYVILYPFRQKLRLKQCILILVLIWIVSILMSLFKLLNYDVHTSSFDDDDEEFDSITSTSATTTTSTSTAQLRKVCEPQKEHLDNIETVFLVVMQYIVPFFIISFTYFRIGFHIYFDDSPSSVTQNHSANKKKVIKMIFIVVILFMICWAPIQLFNILNVLTPALFKSYDNIHIIWFFSNCLAVSNSCYNVFIYGACSARFKTEFKKLFSCLPCVVDDFYDLESNMRKMTMTYYNNYQRNNSCNSQMLFGTGLKKPSTIGIIGVNTATIMTSPLGNGNANANGITANGHSPSPLPRIDSVDSTALNAAPSTPPTTDRTLSTSAITAETTTTTNQCPLKVVVNRHCRSASTRGHQQAPKYKYTSVLKRSESDDHYNNKRLEVRDYSSSDSDDYEDDYEEEPIRRAKIVASLNGDANSSRKVFRPPSRIDEV